MKSEFNIAFLLWNELWKCKSIDLFNIFRKIDEPVVFCCSNIDASQNSSTIIDGLVNGHAYRKLIKFITEFKSPSELLAKVNDPNKSLLLIENVELKNGNFVRLVKIRNPWGKKEWNDRWSDGSPEWNMVKDSEKQRLKYKTKNDGDFWMTFQGQARFQVQRSFMIRPFCNAITYSSSYITGI